MATLWHGRFEGGPAEALQALNDSLPFDRRMFREDIAGSRAHVRMLSSVGLMSEVDSEAVLAALDAVEAEMADGSPSWLGTPALGCTPGGAVTTRWPPTCGSGRYGSWATWRA